MFDRQKLPITIYLNKLQDFKLKNINFNHIDHVILQILHFIRI